MIYLKYLGIAGALLSFLGTILVGFIAQRGIPRSGQTIRAPKYVESAVGWSFIAFGFLLVLIKEILS